MPVPSGREDCSPPPPYPSLSELSYFLGEGDSISQGISLFFQAQLFFFKDSYNDTNNNSGDYSCASVLRLMKDCQKSHCGIVLFLESFTKRISH